MDDAELVGTTRLIYEMGLLKLSKRTGWWSCGVNNPESVAEHSFRTAQIASMLAVLERADPARAAYLALWHDAQETRTGDVPHLGRRYLDADSNEAMAADQTEGLPPDLGGELRALISDYEHGESIEVQCAHDADKLECLIQAVEYRDTGHRNVEGWIESNRAALVTLSAQRIADVAVTMSSQDWHNAALSQRVPKRRAGRK
jgi:putative hydrolases of HD superfamily